ncbi:MAG: hypothetical protein HONBIEJF_00976 [Fimbriimonadaceae bacterium]|nr:hypothetical protein [Fimbriimonadaceae bacterium]
MRLLILIVAVLTVQQAERPWKIRITDAREPGIPMIVSGRVVDKSRNPMAGVRVHVYHTDANGLYQKPGKQGHRLSGTMWTNADGKFEFRTIRPVPYPGGKSGEHFHIELSGGGLPNSFATIQFFDDRPTDKLHVATGRMGGSATYHKGFAWKPDKSINGQRLDVELRF